MKITLVGRPDKVIERGPCVITILQVNTIPALPKGIPTPAPVVTPYAVYIRVKQWRKVAQVMTDPEDALILEGFPELDLPMKCIAVFTTTVTTKKLQQAKKQPKKAHT